MDKMYVNSLPPPFLAFLLRYPYVTPHLYRTQIHPKFQSLEKDIKYPDNIP